MRIPLPHRLIVTVVTMLVLLTACSSDAADDSVLGSGTADGGEETVTTATAPISTVAPTTATVETSSSIPTTTSIADRTASAEAVEFKLLTPTVAGVSDGVTAFADSLDPLRVDDLAAEACTTVSPGLNDVELGVKGLAAYDMLTAEEQASISIDDWVVFYGGLIGFFCPEQLPEIDLDASPVDGTDAERFRAIVTEVSGVSAETELFVSTLTDDRLDELQALACASSSSDLTTEDFGVEIVRSYDRDLDAAEISGIGLSAYSELYGAMVGWFCPGRLPR